MFLVIIYIIYVYNMYIILYILYNTCILFRTRSHIASAFKMLGPVRGSWIPDAKWDLRYRNRGKLGLTRANSRVENQLESRVKPW